MTERALAGPGRGPRRRARGKEAEEGAQGEPEGARGGVSGARGARGGCGGRRAHLPLVSAAIAGHMTEAVAGMTVWALATRVGGRPREGGGGRGGSLQGVQTEGKGRKKDGTPTSPSGNNHRLL